MARKLGSRDRVKRKRKAYGFTKEELIGERKKTRNYMLGGLGVGSLLGYGISRPIANKYEKKINEGLTTLNNLKQQQRYLLSQPDITNTIKGQAMLEDNAKGIAEALKGIKLMRRGQKALTVGLTLGLGSIIAGGVGGYLANQRAAKNRKYRKSIGYKYPSMKPAKYDIRDQF